MIKKAFLISSFFLHIVLTPEINAQNIDSLLKALTTAPPKSAQKAELLKLLARNLTNKSNQDALNYADDLLSLGSEMGNDTYLFEGNMLVGSILVASDKVVQALDHFEQAKFIAARYSSKEWKINYINANNNLAGTFWVLKNAKKAIRLTRSNEPIIKEVRDTLVLGHYYQSMAIFFNEMNQLDPSKYYSIQAIKAYDIVKEIRRKNLAVINLARIEAKQGNTVSSLQRLSAVKKEFFTSNDTASMIVVILEMAEIEIQKKNYDGAYQILHQNSSIFQSKNVSINNNIALSKKNYTLFKATNQLDSALITAEKLLSLTEKAAQLETDKRINDIELSFQIERNLEENKQLKQKNEQAAKINTIWVGVSILFFILFLFTLFIYYRLRKSKSELAKLQLAAIETNQMLNEQINEKKLIISLIVHDVRTPLTIIQLNNQILANNEQKNISLIDEIGKAAIEIHEAILTIQDIESRTIDKNYTHPEVIDARHSVAKLIQDFKAYAKSRSVKLVFTQFSDPLPVEVDPFLLRHILSNLVSNAIKFSPSEKPVQIKSYRQNNDVCISIRDYGIGMNSSKFVEIASNASSIDFPDIKDQSSWGRGLLLAIRFAGKSGGYIQLNGEHPIGSEFILHLPMK